MGGGQDIFGLAERRMAWLSQRQDVLAQNVANANTPGYQAKDISPFQGILDRQNRLAMAGSEPTHLTAAASPISTQTSHTRERSPDGNAVALETELSKVADTASSQELVSNLYRKYNSLFRIALGRS